MGEGQQDAGRNPSTPPAGLGRGSAATPEFRTGDPLPPPPPAPPWSRPEDPAATRTPPAAAPPPPPLPPSRLPAAVTGAVLALVLGAVVAGTAVARHADTHLPPATTTRRTPVATAPSAAAGPAGIEFAAAGGRGRLVLLARTWGATAPGADPGRRHLRVHLELTCTSGRVTHAPAYFSVFDERGRLVETAATAGEPDALPLGTLAPGERVRGHIGFDLPRGAVTLVMSDEVGSVTALRVPA